MSRLRALAIFLYDFVVGDDWRMSIAVVLGLVATVLLAHAGLQWWFVLPLCVAGALAWSLKRAVSRSS